MNKIYLVRHGQDEDNAKGILNGRRDNPLTDLGREQAKMVAQKLKDHNIQVIYSSPLKRAHETARIISKTLDVDELIIDEHLIERDFGIFTGKPFSDITKITGNVLIGDKTTYFLDGEGTEDFPTLLKRGKKILQEINERHTDEKILIVTHSDIGKMIRAAFHEWTWKKGIETPHFANTGILELSDKEDILE